jgi:hypothetical protein
VTPERPDPSEPPADEGGAATDEPEQAGEAYSDDEAAAVAARLEDLGYI